MPKVKKQSLLPTVDISKREVLINEGMYAGTRYRYHPGISIDPETFVVDFGYDFIDNPLKVSDNDKEWVNFIGEILMDILSNDPEIEKE